ncbi:MAG: hypothetical protein NZL85_10960 [Fimbriimonadales bacterium]|nr:hypothetical protein [Fimbriimonadales bacterium]
MSWVSRIRYALFAISLFATVAVLAQPTRTLAVAIDYQPDSFEAQIAQLKALGVAQVVVRLTELPTPTRWQALLDTLDRSELEWRFYLAGLPHVHGWVVLPERYRLRGTEQGVYSAQLPGASQALLAVSPYDQPLLRTLMPLTPSEGRAVIAMGDTAESVLLLYPRLENALPDLWEGWDRYRDALCALLLVRKPSSKFRGWIIESGWEAQSAAAFPDGERFHAEWLGFLKLRYSELTELERAWDLSASLSRYEQAAQLIPLWHGERGLPYLVSPDGKQKPLEVEPRQSRFWDDYHAFLGERWRTLLKGLRQALLALTPDVEFHLVQPMPDPTELPTPEALRDPLLPSGYRLPATLRSEWRPLLVIESARARRPLAMLEWTGESVERASLAQNLAREMGVPLIIWQVQNASVLTREVWQTLQATDSEPSTPEFIPFPTSLWGMTSLQKWRTGWWLPADPSGELQSLFWGFELFAFWRPIETQALDKEGKPTTVRRIDLYLWTAGGEREITLRRFDQTPLSAINLDGETVALTLRGDTVRLKVGSVPVRLRGFEVLPLCESVINDWTQRVEALLKRGAPAGQDAQALRFVFDSALATYRRDRAQGFSQVRNAWYEIETASQPYRLIEAESAREHTFGAVRRDLSVSGGATLWLNTPLKPTENGYYARYALNLRTEGAYNLFLACRVKPPRNGTPDSIEWQIFSSTDEKTPLARGTVALDVSRAVSHYADRFLWLPLGSATLKAGDHILLLRYLPASGQTQFYAEWDMLLLAPPGITPAGVLPPAY